MAFSFRGSPDSRLMQFVGPWGRIKAKVVFGRLVPDVVWGLKALERPNCLRSLRYFWAVTIDSRTRRNLILARGGQRVEILFFDEIPYLLEWSLRDVFERHEPAGTRAMAAARRADKARELVSVRAQERAAAGIPDRNSSPSEWAAYYRRIKVEDPEAWAALKGEKVSSKQHGRPAEGDAT